MIDFKAMVEATSVLMLAYVTLAVSVGVGYTLSWYSHYIVKVLKLKYAARKIKIEEAQSSEFREYTELLRTTLDAKNRDYGNSVEKSMDKYGLVSVIIRLNDKFNRLSALTTSGEASVKDESLADTVLDVAGYSVLLYKYLIEHKNIKK